jgi:Uri superfamily endonuclease
MKSMNTLRKGYVVEYECESGIVRAGKREWKIEEGSYLYVGSCGKSCTGRLSRHLAPQVKRKRWHVDHLKELCTPVSALVLPLTEQELVGKLPTERALSKFGSSDYPDHAGHLFQMVLVEALSHLLA